MAIPAMALLQQHDARWHILIEPAARRRAAIEARGHSELGGGRNRAVKTNRLVSIILVSLSNSTHYGEDAVEFSSTVTDL